MSIERMRDCYRTEPLELKSSINTVQFLASIPIIGQLVSIVVELPLKIIATFSSRFRETELGAYYSQLDSKALGVSVLVPVIGSVVSRIALREFNFERGKMLEEAAQKGDVEKLKFLFKTCQFTDKNFFQVFDELTTSCKEREKLISAFKTLMDRSPDDVRARIVAHLKTEYTKYNSTKSKGDPSYPTGDTAALLPENAASSLRGRKEQDEKTSKLLKELLESIGESPKAPLEL